MDAPELFNHVRLIKDHVMVYLFNYLTFVCSFICLFVYLFISFFVIMVVVEMSQRAPTSKTCVGLVSVFEIIQLIDISGFQPEFSL